MRKILYNILIIATILASNSCGDFLGNKPKGITIPKYYDEYEKLLNGTKQSGNDDLEYLTDNVHLLNEDASASSYIYIGKNYNQRNLFSFAPGQIFLEGEKDGTWNSAYKRIFTYNIVANEVVKSQGSTEQNKKRIRAEALFSRAYDYFMLVNMYAKHYNPNSANTDYGVSYITEGNINLMPNRNTVKEVYDNIFADLKEAEESLAEVVPNKTHPSKNALYAFYSRIYLTMGNFEKALENANKVLEYNSDILNLNDYIKQEGKTWDRVVLKEDATKRLPDIDHPEAVYISFLPSNLQGSVLLSKSARELFKKDVPEGVQDLRKEYYCAEDVVNLGGTPEQIPGECAWVLYSNINVGFTSVESMLIAAECEARIGSVDRAMQLINKLRQARFSSPAPLRAASKADALNKVLEERRREFMMKGFRYFDLRRLNVEPEHAVTVSHSADGQTWTLSPNDPKYILPISQEVLDFNPDMPVYDRK